MQDQYIDHYACVIFDKWARAVCKEMGSSPFTAVLQNHLYTQDPGNPEYVRIQSFLKGLRQFWEKAKELPDPDPAPIVYRTSISDEVVKKVEAIKAEVKAKQKSEHVGFGPVTGPVDLAVNQLSTELSHKKLEDTKPLPPLSFIALNTP